MSKTAATIETRGRSDVAQTETAVPPRDDVARRAYERFVERGGHALEDGLGGGAIRSSDSRLRAGPAAGRRSRLLAISRPKRCLRIGRTSRAFSATASPPRARRSIEGIARPSPAISRP